MKAVGIISIIIFCVICCLGLYVYIDTKNAVFYDIIPWEPQKVDSLYSNYTEGWGRDTKRSDWQATDKLNYEDFLNQYYDSLIQLNSDSSDYSINKKILLSYNTQSGSKYNIYEYEFCPKDYKYTVLLSSGMNADETQGIWSLATFMRCVFNREEPMLSIAKDKVRFKVIPIINADGFDKDTLNYYIEDGVNPNFNFDNNGSWYSHSSTIKGSAPDSEPIIRMLKKWVTSHKDNADLWIDLHTGRWKDNKNTHKILDLRYGTTSAYFAKFNIIDRQLIQFYYMKKGTVKWYHNIGRAMSIRSNPDYQKHVYSVDYCNIPSVMPEMHLESTAYGEDGHTNNSANGIKCYVLQIRQMMMYSLNKIKK